MSLIPLIPTFGTNAFINIFYKKINEIVNYLNGNTPTNIKYISAPFYYGINDGIPEISFTQDSIWVWDEANQFGELTVTMPEGMIFRTLKCVAYISFPNVGDEGYSIGFGGQDPEQVGITQNYLNTVISIDRLNYVGIIATSPNFPEEGAGWTIVLMQTNPNQIQLRFNRVNGGSPVLEGQLYIEASS